MVARSIVEKGALEKSGKSIERVRACSPTIGRVNAITIEINSSVHGRMMYGAHTHTAMH